VAEDLVYTKDELPGVTKLGLSTIEEEIRNGNFPPPRELSRRRVGWLRREIVEWLESRPVSTQPPPPNTGARKPRARAPAAPALHPAG
jgi:prophage regulatory protein